ncbi:hypothetical protein M8C21_010383 [Ambrosia artemisiifolia]|uniref:Uncharacterized protein n=1 Tax=Ambrosia artemisiifolia TaxID=4212 RepID=A0AAD5G8J3_AMBAR|nr:hypothetical protein M8C21_010383 [Ambrosia artemisiifolia]
MVSFTQLPIEVVDLIIIMLAISTNGAREIATISATCKLFKNLAERAHVLREVNFRCLALTEDFSMHHHPKDLLCVCTQIGNQAAKNIFAKALLYDDWWFKQLIVESNQEALDLRVSYSGLLDYHSIVRSFIRHGSCADMVKMYEYLLNYVISFVGYKVASRFGILDAIYTMCFEMFKIIKEHHRRSLGSPRDPDVYTTKLNYQVREERKKVIVIFDQLFPCRPV